MEHDAVSVPRYNVADRDHMRRLLQKASPIIDLIAEDQVPLGSPESVELIDSVAAEIGYENENQKDDDEPQDKSTCMQEWLTHASELALDLLSEDEAVRETISDASSVDSEPLHFFLSIHHPRLAVRWWHAKKLENPVRIAYVGSWTSDDQIKESLSVKINSTWLITEMIFGDHTGQIGRAHV